MEKEVKTKSLFGEPIVEIKEEKQKKDSGNALFDMIGMMFKNPKRFTEEYSNIEKANNMFMCQRIAAMKYPIQSEMFNRLGINAAEVVQYWGDNLSRLYNSTPGWIYAGFKAIKKEKESKKEKLNVKESTIEYYCRKNECSRRELMELVDYCGTEFVNELKQLEKDLS